MARITIGVDTVTTLITKEIFKHPTRKCTSVTVNYTGDDGIEIWATTQSGDDDWERVEKNVEHTFTKSGTQLRLQFVGETGKEMTRCVASYNLSGG